MRHPKAEKWEAELDKAMHELDHFFEIKYAGKYQLHPARRTKGATANPSHDGLFSIVAGFTMGLGSELGKGYVVDIKLMTLEKIDPAIIDEIENEAIKKLGLILPKYFPATQLDIGRDGKTIKIHGDLSLGTA